MRSGGPPIARSSASRGRARSLLPGSADLARPRRPLGPRATGLRHGPARADAGRVLAPSSPGSTVVEFFGLPGAGKSTVATLTRRDLTDRGIRAQVVDRRVAIDVPAPLRIGRKLLLVADRGISHPVRSARAVTSIGTSQTALADAATRPMQFLVTQALLARARRTPGVHLLEEGLLQALWSAGLRAGGNRSVGSLAADLGAVVPDLVVVVEAPISAIESRLGSRGSRQSRTERLVGAERELELTRGEALLVDVLAWWASISGPDRTVRVDNGVDGPPDLEETLRTIATLAGRDPGDGSAAQ